jgi:hypothetical protein
MTTFSYKAREIAQIAQRGQLTTALDHIRALLTAVDGDAATGEPLLAGPAVDELLSGIGRWLAPVSTSRNADHVVVIATDLDQAGGDWRVIEQIIAAEPAGHVTVLASGPAAAASLTRPADTAQVSHRSAPNESSARRMRWLQEQLVELRPARTWLATRPHDVVAAAACQPELVGDLVFCHHDLSESSVGACLPHARHVDMDAWAFEACRRHTHPANAFLPRAVPQVAASPAVRKGDTIVTATSSRAADRNTFGYDLTIPLVIARALSTTGGSHVHLGPLDHVKLRRIEDLLSQAGIDSDRFLYYPRLPDPADLLIDRGVTLYIGGVPQGRDDVLIAAASAGIPLLLHEPYRSPRHSDIARAWPEVRRWRDLPDLDRALRGDKVEDLKQEGAAARGFWERSHSPAVIGKAFAEIVAPGTRPGAAVVVEDQLRARYDARFFGGGADQDRADAMEKVAWETLSVAWDHGEVLPEGVRFHIDLVQTRFNVAAVYGWAYADVALTELRVIQDRELVAAVPIDGTRPDVAKANKAPQAGNSGFLAHWQCGALPADRPVSFTLVFMDGDEELARADATITHD